MANHSRTALLEFLDYLSTKGLMNKDTAAAKKAAANRVLGILDDEEAKDVSILDIDELMSRFHNLEGAKFTPESLNTYKSRLRSAIDDFLRYQRDPLNFRVSGSAPRSERSKTTAPEQKKETRSQGRSPGAFEAPPATVNIIPIQIRADLTVKIQGLPFDLTTSEAAKIANVVKALAAGD
jgi:hypothetical protein